MSEADIALVNEARETVARVRGHPALEWYGADDLKTLLAQQDEALSAMMVQVSGSTGLNPATRTELTTYVKALRLRLSEYEEAADPQVVQSVRKQSEAVLANAAALRGHPQWEFHELGGPELLNSLNDMEAGASTVRALLDDPDAMPKRTEMEQLAKSCAVAMKAIARMTDILDGFKGQPSPSGERPLN